MHHHRCCLLIWGLCLALFMAVVTPPRASAQSEAPLPRGIGQLGAQIKTPTAAQPILKLAEVRVGMKGYGLTVFSGTNIEPFAVEVVAVVPDSEAKRGTFWVVCDHPRLEISGPVQGMSGSPIYLWDDTDAPTNPQKLGEGGTLAGAFAFGYAGVRECLAGIQPIELMREVGDRVDADAPQARGYGNNPAFAIASLRRLEQQTQRRNTRFEAQVLAEALQGERLDLNAAVHRAGMTTQDVPTLPTLTPKASTQLDWQQTTPMPLGLPMSVGNPALAAALSPIMAGSGLVPIAAQPGVSFTGPALIGSEPHRDINPAEVYLEPGSPVCVPFAWGDLDFSGNGTVTDVLPDGTVLAFGHAMDGIGDTAIPMATGYVHFVVPNRNISFRQAGALSLQGTVLRDENSAIAGRSDVVFASAPARITVQIDGQPERDYRYRLLKHPTMSGPIAAALIANSLIAVQGLPQYNTVTLSLTAVLSTGDTYEQTVELPMAEPGVMVEAVLPYMMAVLGNPFEDITLDALTATINVKAENQAAEITRVWLDRPSVRPGEAVTIFAELQPFRGPKITVPIDFTVPRDTPPKTYELQVTDRTGLLQATLQARPDIMAIFSLDDLLGAVDVLTEPGFRQLHAFMLTQGAHLAMTDRTMTDLPTSRAALFAGAGPSRVTPAGKLVHQSADANGVVVGEAAVSLIVKPALQGADDER